MNLQPKRIKWLVKHRKLWQAYHPRSSSWWEIEKLLFAKMKEEDLFDRHTTILDVSFEYLIEKARKKMK